MSESELYLINRSIQKTCAITANYKNIMVSVSGGKDSDVMLDMLLKTCPKEKLNFVFFDTGIEFAPTKKHLDFLENKYGIYISRKSNRTCTTRNKTIRITFLIKRYKRQNKYLAE